MKSNHKKAESRADLNQLRKFNFVQLTTNNMGFLMELKAVEIFCSKTEKSKRVICIGASTTGNYIEANGKVFSYPRT